MWHRCNRRFPLLLQGWCRYRLNVLLLHHLRLHLGLHLGLDVVLLGWGHAVREQALRLAARPIGTDAPVPFIIADACMAMEAGIWATLTEEVDATGE